MKNKKLFAILTLVCFMFTLMPVAAFAAAPTAVLTDAKLYNDGTKAGVSFDVESISGFAAGEEFEVKVELYAGEEKLTTLTRDFKDLTALTATVLTKGTHDKWEMTPWTAYDNVVPTKAILYLNGEEVDENTNFDAVAAGWATFAGVVEAITIDDATSTFVAVKGNHSVKVNDDVDFELDVEDRNYGPAAGKVFIWAEETAGKASSALNIVSPAAVSAGIANVWVVDVVDYADVKVSFSRAGEYTVYAAPAVNVKNADTNEVAELSKFTCDFSVINVKSGSANPEKDYTATIVVEGTPLGTDVAANNEVTFATSITPNNVMDTRVVAYFANDGVPMKGKTIAIETNSSSIEVSRTALKTNTQGRIVFDVAGSVEGTYEVIMSVDGVDWTINVTVGNTAATYINTVKQPASPLALWETFPTAAQAEVTFAITDINGNIVGAGSEGMTGINANTDGKYIVVTKAPADSNIDSKYLGLDYNAGVWHLTGVNTMDAEGTYAVKVILDNGAYATAEWTVKKFQTPVRLIIGTAVDVIELGGNIVGQLKYMDANGVMKAANDADIAGKGYALVSAAQYGADNGFKIEVKDDEKYVGEKVTVTAVSTKYDLVATKDFTVAEGASAIVFADAKAEVNVNNRIAWNVVDASGNKVALDGSYAIASQSGPYNGPVDTTIKYVVLDKPEGAKVSVNDATNPVDLTGKGEGKLSLTSNKVGNVEVQVIVKATYNAVNEDAEQVKYYTGTAVIPVGLDDFEDVVVMSIGSKEIVINSDVKEMLCEAVIKDGRTMVPFRAGLEALGATVDYDATTQSVIAEMNGVKVVMTLGEKAYTVNGVAKVADVAPYLNVEASTTMVPASFVAAAFGINVDYTTNPDGTVADVLFAN